MINNLKKLFTYALLLTATLSLTALSCEDLSDEITIDVPTEVTKTIRISTSEAGPFTKTEPVDIASDEFNENRDKMKEFKVVTLTFDVVDNLTGGSAVPTNVYLSFEADFSGIGLAVNGATLQDQLNGFTPEFTNELRRAIEDWILDYSSNTVMDIELSGDASGSMDYTITFTMTSTIQVGAK
ncbi:hypothetical protein SanaruYs_34200 [Chryseotalea sanaruensis]|uniref:Uncharacterized protein n=1 Tax=Chryseotalea sanaruensis TaxID=2482724 RepID=A0A401UE81_9BACT|nr:hypothetical protein [Chryseotalea sanaruensis]GCC53177.1 hypothetical protein SanaruYs_34200 [Chryseotalea sanaruensis]